MLSFLFFFILNTLATTVVVIDEARPVYPWHINTTDINVGITAIEGTPFFSSDIIQTYRFLCEYPVQTTHLKNLQFLFYIQGLNGEETLPIEVDIRSSQNKQNYDSYVTTFTATTNTINEVIIPIDMDWVASIQFRICQKAIQYQYDYLLSHIGNVQFTDSLEFIPFEVDEPSEDSEVSEQSEQSIIPPIVSSDQPVISTSSEYVIFYPYNWTCENGSSFTFILFMTVLLTFIL